MDPVQLIEHDHRSLERLFGRMEHSLARGDEQGAAATLRQVVRALSIHAAIEEQFLYPALRGAKSDETILYAVEEHHAVKLTLAELEATPAVDPRFATKARLLMRHVREHVKEEERDLLPAIERTLDPDQRRELGATLSNAKLLSPTRPHPTAPEAPPANLLAGPVVGALDRVRDAVRDGLLGARDGVRTAVELAFILLRRLSTRAEQRGRDAMDDLAARTRMVAVEARQAGRRTLEDVQGRGAEAARQLEAPARRVARRVRTAAGRGSRREARH